MREAAYLRNVERRKRAVISIIDNHPSKALRMRTWKGLELLGIP
jgi:hypothetical protein